LTEIDLKIFENMTKVKTMDSLFSDCEKLTKIYNLKDLYTGNVITMANMFDGCTNLKFDNLKALENFETKNVENFENMFKNCNSLVEFDISNWNMEKQNV